MATVKTPKARAESNGRARVLHVRAKNFKQIREVDIDVDGTMHAIKGDTDQGKTSFLQAIMATIKGAEKSMVRHGSDSAELEVQLDTALIHRIISADPTKKDVLMGKDARGAAIDKVQDFLNTLCGPTAFNPIKWVQLGAEGGKGHTERLRSQRQQLLEAIAMSLTSDDVVEAAENLGEEFAEALGEVNLDGVDFDQHPFTVCQRLEKACMEFYSLQNSRAKDAENVLKTVPAPSIAAPKAAIEEVQAEAEKARQAFYDARARQQGATNLAQRVADLKAKIAREAQELPERDKLEKTASTYLEQEETLTGEITSVEEQIAALRQEIERKRLALAEVQDKLRKCEHLDQRWSDQDARIDDLMQLEEELSHGGAPDDLEALQRAMQRATDLVEAKKLQDRHDQAATAAADARTRADVVYRLVELFRDQLPKSLLSQADLPVQGLGFNEDTILIDGIPLHQLGTSRQYRIGILIAAALNPQSAFVLVDQAESMGKKDLAEVAQVAAERGLQIIASFVAPDAVPAEGVTVMAGGYAQVAN